MNPIAFCSYLVMCAVCFTAATLQFCTNYRLSQPSGNALTYIRLKKTLAITAYIECVADLLVLNYLYNGLDYMQLDHFVMPMVFYVQLCLVTYSLLKLIHSRIRLRPRYAVVFTLPLTAILAIHAIMYFCRYGAGFNSVRYIEFLATPESTALGYVLYAMFGLEILVCAHVLMKESATFNASIDNFFTGLRLRRGKLLNYMLISFIAYFVLYAIDFIVSDREYDLFVLYVRMALVVFNAVAVFNAQKIFFDLVPAFDRNLSYRRSDDAAKPQTAQAEATGEKEEPRDTLEKEEAEPTEPTADTSSIMRQPSSSVAFNERLMDINTIILDWMQRSDKPYLHEGITITQVAQEMDLHPRLLSRYINNVMKINFNTWINNLKVVETKRIIEEHPDMTMTDIAIRAGFTDATSMSKIFKSFVGVPPSVYRTQKKQ